MSLLASFYMFFAYDPVEGGFQFVKRFEWSKELGIAFYLGVDDVERFEREGDLLVISGHVSAGFGLGGGKVKILEFTSAPKAEYHHVRRLADLTAIALYHSNHGAELLRAGQMPEALPWLRKAVAIDPELGDAWVDLGVGLRRAGDLDGAESAYRRALEVNPQGASAYQNLAVLLRMRGHDPEADALMALSVRASAQSPFSFLALGDLSLAQGRTDEARRFYRRAMYLNREDAVALASVVVDLRVTQIVNQVVGVHAVLKNSSTSS